MPSNRCRKGHLMHQSPCSTRWFCNTCRNLAARERRARAYDDDLKQREYAKRQKWVAANPGSAKLAGYVSSEKKSWQEMKWRECFAGTHNIAMQSIMEAGLEIVTLDGLRNPKWEVHTPREKRFEIWGDIETAFFKNYREGQAWPAISQ